MAHTSAWSQLWARRCLSGLLFLVFSACTQAASVAYCSPDRGEGANYLTSIYMSNGVCSDQCRSSYAFAVVLGTDCWCSNWVPAHQESTSLCNDPCPGYPTDQCGNSGQQLYAYLNLGGTPSGTAGAGGSSSSASSSSSSISSRVSSSPSSNTPPLPSSSASADPTQVYTEFQTITASGSGSVRTVVVTPTAAATSDSALGASSSSSSGSGISSGTVAGIVIGVAIGIGLIIGGIVFLWLRRRHRKNLAAVSEGGSFTSPSNVSKSNGGIPSRQVSQMSSAGLLTRPARMNTSGLPVVDDHRSAGPSTLNSDRNSTHMTVDQRLNPWAIYSNEDSRASNVSLQDNHDYSRQLRVANPDP